MLSGAIKPSAPHTSNPFSAQKELKRESEDIFEEYLARKQGIKAKDDAEQVRLLRMAADKGLANAQFELARVFKHGELKLGKNINECIRYLSMAANQNHPGALYALGTAYMNGRGVKRNDSKAMRYFELAAEQEVHKAKYYLGKYYAEGRVVTRDMPKAIQYYRESAKYVREAMLELQDLADGYWGFFGDPAAKYHMAILQKRPIPDLGDLLAKLIVNNPNDLNLISEKKLLSPHKIAELRLELKMAKDPDLSRQVGFEYLLGKNGRPQDFVKAEQLLKQAAAQNPNVAIALSEANLSYIHGKIAHTDKDAARLFRKAASLGNIEALKRLDAMAQGPFWGLFGGNHYAKYQQALLYKTSLSTIPTHILVEMLRDKDGFNDFQIVEKLLPPESLETLEKQVIHREPSKPMFVSLAKPPNHRDLQIDITKAAMSTKPTPKKTLTERFFNFFKPAPKVVDAPVLPKSQKILRNL